MRVRLVRRPGQPGTREYVEEYGARLICVRYRYDKEQKRRYKTIEIIVDEGPWEPPLAGETLVGVKIGHLERALQQDIRNAGGTWYHELRIWAIRYENVVALNLIHRVAGTMDEIRAGLRWEE